MAPATSLRNVLRVSFSAALLCGGLSACVDHPATSKLDAIQPSGSPFSQALFKDYAYLARSFGQDVGSAGTTFDADTSISLRSFDADVTDLANAYAEKAVVAGRGEEVIPDPAPEDDIPAQQIHIQVLKDLDAGRDKFPDDTARVQTEYDCWVMNGRLASQRAASAQCRRALDIAMAKLEHEIAAASPPPPPASDATAGAAPDAAATGPDAAAAAPPPPAPDAATAAPPPAPAGGYTVYFDRGSDVITVDDMAVIQKAIDDARNGRQSHIAIVGYADASEKPAKRLSEKRAAAVSDLLVKLGARKEAIQVSGAGSAPPDVQGKAARAVITLIP